MHNPQPAIPATAVNKFQRRPKLPMLQDRNQTTKRQPYQSNASVSLQSGALYAQNPNQPFPSFWDESSVNWQNQPPWFDYFFGPFLVAAANQTVAVDVTQYVRNVAAGRQNNGLL